MICSFERQASKLYVCDVVHPTWQSYLQTQSQSLVCPAWRNLVGLILMASWLFLGLVECRDGPCVTPGSPLHLHCEGLRASMQEQSSEAHRKRVWLMLHDLRVVKGKSQGFELNSVPVCRGTFCKACSIGKGTLQNLLRTVRDEGPPPDGRKAGLRNHGKVGNVEGQNDYKKFFFRWMGQLGHAHTSRAGWMVMKLLLCKRARQHRSPLSQLPVVEVCRAWMTHRKNLTARAAELV